MRCLHYLVFLLGSPVLGQIQNLATDHGGSVLYFASTFRQLGTNQPQHLKLFRWTLNGAVQLYAQRECLPDGMLSTFCALQMPSVSSDGEIVAFSAARSCSFVSAGGATACDTYETLEGTVQTRDGTEVLRNAGWMQLTPGGRYAVSAPKCPGSAYQCLVGSYGSRLVFDLRAPAGTPPVKIDSRFDARQVAGDGTLIEAKGCGLVALSDIHNLQTVRRLPVSGCVSSVAIAPNGNTAIYETLLSDYGQLHAIYSLDLRTAVETPLFADCCPRDPLQRPIQFCVSDDGKVVLVLGRDTATGPRHWLFAISADGSRSRWFAPDRDGYQEVALSGDGLTAFALTRSSRLLRINLESGAKTEITPVTPTISEVRGAFQPGSANRILGGGFAGETIVADAFPAPLELGGVSVTYDGQPVPVLKISPEELLVQIPWEMNLRLTNLRRNLFTASIRVRAPHEGPFADPELELERSGGSDGLFEPALHEDGTRVSAASPVRPDEILQLFFTGLGPVESPVETGVPAPADPPVRGVSPLSCVMRSDFDSQSPPMPVEVIFVGLAPGRIGVYLVSLRTPSFVPSPVSFDCSFPGTQVLLP